MASWAVRDEVLGLLALPLPATRTTARSGGRTLIVTLGPPGVRALRRSRDGRPRAVAQAYAGCVRPGAVLLMFGRASSCRGRTDARYSKRTDPGPVEHLVGPHHAQRGPVGHVRVVAVHDATPQVPAKGRRGVVQVRERQGRRRSVAIHAPGVGSVGRPLD